MIVVDGSQGEGGGQVLRTSLALSLVTGRPFRIERIRAGRERPGLLRQHLACVRAAVEVGGASADGAELGSTSLEVCPGRLRPGSHRFVVGTAGSTALVLQSILPALLVTEGEFVLEVEGGTHAEAAPPFEFLVHAFVPAIARMGGRVEIELVRHGFYPAGGGLVRARVVGATLRPLELLERGEVTRRTARAVVANLPLDVAEREVEVLRRKLGWSDEDARAETIAGSPGPGNAVVVEIHCEHAAEVVSAYGAKNRRAEAVAEDAVKQARRFLAARVPVGEHLADQLLVPLALAGGGTFRTLAPSRHATTNADVIKLFLDMETRFIQEDASAWRVEVRPPG